MGRVQRSSRARACEPRPYYSVKVDCTDDRSHDERRDNEWHPYTRAFKEDQRMHHSQTHLPSDVGAPFIIPPLIV
jgi:hypothetical protein